MSINEQAVSTLYSVSSLTLDIPALGLHLPVMDVLFTILVHYSYRSALGESHAYIGWGQGLVATLFMASGGGCTVSLIRGETFGLLQSNLTWAIHCFIYWAMFSNSFIYRCTQSLFEMPLGEHLFTLSDAVLRTSAMVQYGIEGVTANPGLGAGKSVAKIICGTLAGCGGGLWIGKITDIQMKRRIKY
ncbi:uncharacterized protein BYT42DRAFT_493541 [Radiomyces spectabilis]|uniref:uncharacterized protein n=1 Tax=Radiomyces spectabilis TaxID=64574 RepID=UPI002220F504|nr:uncharacterized protein BYT42DRAFT_493541 [Radiomyces spectabilis]KAI8385056.1 hypothetical protein BYT42DRAFT_493541 [Radiomyces spectabilis]